MQSDTSAVPAEAKSGQDLFYMTTLVEEPRLSVDSLRFLQQFEEAFRARVYNLVEDEVRETGDRSVSKQVIQKCVERALREYVDQLKQRRLPNIDG